MKDKLSKVKMGFFMRCYQKYREGLVIKYVPIVDEQVLREELRKEKCNWLLALAWYVCKPDKVINTFDQ